MIAHEGTGCIARNFVARPRTSKTADTKPRRCDRARLIAIASQRPRRRSPKRKKAGATHTGLFLSCCGKRMPVAVTEQSCDKRVMGLPGRREEHGSAGAAVMAARVDADRRSISTLTHLLNWASVLSGFLKVRILGPGTPARSHKKTGSIKQLRARARRWPPPRHLRCGRVGQDWPHVWPHLVDQAPHAARS